MSSRIALACTLGLLLQATIAHAGEIGENTMEADLECLQGSWQPISAEYKGKAIDPKEHDWTLEFAAGRVVQLRRGKVHVEGSVQVVKPGPSSKRAYWKYTNVDVTDAVIYFFVGRDTLISCWSGEQRNVPEWPTEFSTRSPKGGSYLVVWKRQKKLQAM